jgi:hypothetical protein
MLVCNMNEERDKRNKQAGNSSTIEHILLLSINFMLYAAPRVDDFMLLNARLTTNGCLDHRSAA